jgi:outer membrane receptor for ferrienterochelin and colicin
MPASFRLAAALIAAVALAPPLVAQDPLQPGRIVGRVIDGGSGDPVPGAQVTVDGTSITGRSDLSGRYTLLNVPPGRHTVTVRVIGYAAKSVTGVEVAAGQVVPLDVSLAAAAIQVAAVEVTAAVERGSVARAIEEQRSATQIVSSISQEQIKKSPDSDAGQVVQRVSGVTVQDGKYVFVRGLGERYTTTSLNNARIPSPEPERKTVPLDLFPAGLLQSITTSKTFTPEQPGDFSGAQVDLRTREFPTARTLSLSTSMGLNDAVTFQDVLAAPRLGSEWLAFAGSERAIPTRAAAGGSFTQGDINDIIASFRNVWLPWNEQAKPNASFGISLGGEDIVGNRPLGYVASLTYSESQEIRRDEERATPTYGGVPDSILPVDRSRGTTGSLGVLWGGLLNLTTRLGTATISLNNTYTRSADNQATRHFAYKEEFQRVFDATRLTMVERTVRSNQLRGEHLLGSRHSWTWALTSSAVRRNEPDRSDLRYETDSTTGTLTPTAWFGQARSAVRTFSDLTEDALEASTALGWGFGSTDRPGRLKVGGAYRHTTRDADTRAFDIVNLSLTDIERRAGPEQVFAATNALDSAFFMFADAQLGRYDATDNLIAGFVQIEVPLSSRLQLIGGARVERWMLDLTTTTGGSTRPTIRRNTDVLPALALNAKVSDQHTVRLSVSQTVARPEYREMSTAGYRDFIGGLDVFGNDTLQRSLIRNVDARWEWYPNPGELISIGAFAKHFDRPIEKVVVNTTGANVLSFINAAGGRNYGLEVELRKNLITVAPALAPFSVFANATMMHSRIQPGSANLTNADRAMVGQAGYVVNAGLGYTSSDGGVNATVLFNVVGRRISEAGANPLTDAYEEARHLLDVSFQAPLPGGLALKLDGKNLLDSPVHVTQGSLTRLRYTTGRVFSMGLTWVP